MDYDALVAEILRSADSLRDADEASLAAATERLKRLAVQLPDELSRNRAMARIDKLPALIFGPRVGISEQYERAVQLVGQAHGMRGSTEERIAAAERAASEIAVLAAQAPVRESGTIRRMNSSLARLIAELRSGTTS